jgi:hypothetical protein
MALPSDPTHPRAGATGQSSLPIVVAAQALFLPGDKLPVQIQLELADGSTRVLLLTPQAVADLGGTLGPIIRSASQRSP